MSTSNTKNSEKRTVAMFVAGTRAEQSVARLFRAQPDLMIQAFVITYELDRPEWLEEFDIPWRSAQDYLSHVDCNAIDQFALQSQTWFRALLPDMADASDWEGISLGLVSAFEVGVGMLEAAKDAVVMRRVIEAEEPKRIVVAADTAAVLAAYRCAASGRALDVLPVEAATQIQPVNRPSKRRLRDWASRLLGRAWLHLVPRLRPAPAVAEDAGFHQLFYASSHPLRKTPFIIIWASLEDSALDWQVRVFDGRWPLPWRGRLPLDEGRWSAIRRTAGQVFAERWERIRRSPSAMHGFTCAGIDLWEAMEAQLARLFTDLFPTYAANVNALKHLFTKAKVRTVVTAEDVLPYERSMVYMGRQLGAPSICHPNGASFTAQSFLTLQVADIYELWAPARADPLSIQQGRLTSVQTAASRWLAARESEVSQGAKGSRAEQAKIVYLPGLNGGQWPDGGRFFLFAKYPTKLSHSVLRRVCQAAESRQWRLLIKCHPRQDEAEVRREVLRFARKNVEVAGAADITLAEALSWADVAISHNTTAGLFALIGNKPLVQVDLPGTGELFTYAREGAALLATTPEEIGQAVDRILTDAQLREELATRAELFLDRHAGPNDGRSTERLGAIIIEQMRAAGADRSRRRKELSRPHVAP